MTAGSGPASQLIVAGHRPGRQSLGGGGQGSVYPLEDDAGLVMKLFKPNLVGDELSDRLRHLQARTRKLASWQPGTPAVAWPIELVRRDDQIVGYVMRRFGPPEQYGLYKLFVPAFRFDKFPQADWRFLNGVARNLASVVANLHEAEFVVGDLTPANTMVGLQGYVTLLDSDSMQFTVGGRVFSCTVVSEGYAPPEVVSSNPFPRSAATDCFSLAVIVLQLLLCGDHPFLGHPPDGEAQPQDNIREARSHLIDPGSVMPPAWAVSRDVLPPEMQRLTKAALFDGHHDFPRRPTAKQWATALDDVAASISSCPVGHTFSGHLPGCPWCERLRNGLPDPFGKTLAWVADQPAGGTVPRAARPRQTAPPPAAPRFPVTPGSPPPRSPAPSRRSAPSRRPAPSRPPATPRVRAPRPSVSKRSQRALLNGWLAVVLFLALILIVVTLAVH